MNILFILDHFWPHIGGAQTLFDLLTKQHIDQGDTVHVLTNKHTPSLPDYEMHNNIHITRVGMGRKNRIKMMQQGSKIIKEHNVDLIHTSTYSSALPAWILSKQHNITNQIHIHEIYGELWHRFLGYKAYCNKRFEKLVVGLLPWDSYICVSHYTLNSVRTHYNLPDHKLHLQSNPIDHDFRKPYDKGQEEQIRTDKFKELEELGSLISDLPAEAGCDVVSSVGLYYGRTGVEKGLHLYIQALPDIIKLIPNFHAVIIAPNSEHKPNIRSKHQTSHSLQQQIKQLGIEKHITRIPPVNSQEEIKKRITASNVVILPSLTEGFGYAMHEVALMNKPLITTQVGGQIETLGNLTIINNNSSSSSTIYWMKQITSEEIVNGVKQFINEI